jgi:lipopolysaccharide/colanic/teichoic acid biosynthesis glycosyltransferase
MNTKLATDIALALSGLIRAASQLIVAMIGIMMCLTGSPILAQERVGLSGRRLTMFKPRTHEGQPTLGQRLLAVLDEP